MFDYTIRDGDIDDSFLATAINSPVVACDSETSGLDWEDDNIGLIQLFVPDAGVSLVRPVPDTRPTRLIRLLDSAEVQKVFHHAMFDLRFMAKAWGVRPANIACTKIMTKILGPTGESSLKYLLAKHLGVEISKEMQLSDWFCKKLSDEQIRYAIDDVVCLPKLASALSAKLSELQLQELTQACFDHIPCRVQLDLFGLNDVYSY